LASENYGLGHFRCLERVGDSLRGTSSPSGELFERGRTFKTRLVTALATTTEAAAKITTLLKDVTKAVLAITEGASFKYCRDREFLTALKKLTHFDDLPIIPSRVSPKSRKTNLESLSKISITLIITYKQKTKQYKN
jgi:hypothetical protein